MVFLSEITEFRKKLKTRKIERCFVDPTDLFEGLAEEWLRS